MRFYYSLKIAHPIRISRWSGMFRLGVIMITRCPLLGLRVRDSKAFQDSAPNSDFAEEQDVLSILERDV